MDADDLAFAGAAVQARMVRDREVGARELAEAVLARIERLQPALNCFSAVTAERALADADEIERQVLAQAAGPLAGAPVAVKDNTDVAGVPTSHGAPRGRPAAEPRLSKGLNAPFADHDVLLTPVTATPLPAADYGEGKGAVRTFREMLPWAIYTGHWNGTGEPAASVPAGFDAEGMPTAVQLVAPPGREDVLFSLAAQIEGVRPWAHHRPPLATS